MALSLSLSLSLPLPLRRSARFVAVQLQCKNQNQNHILLSLLRALLLLSLLMHPSHSKTGCGWYSEYANSKSIPMDVCANYIENAGYRSTRYTCDADGVLLRTFWTKFQCKGKPYDAYEVLSGVWNCTDADYQCNQYVVLEYYGDCTGKKNIGDLASNCKCVDDSFPLMFSMNECLFDEIVSDEYRFRIVNCEGSGFEIWYYDDSECQSQVPFTNTTDNYRSWWVDGCHFDAGADFFSRIDMQHCAANRLGGVSVTAVFVVVSIAWLCLQFL